LKKFRMMKI